MKVPLPIHGRGSSDNPPNRFIPIHREPGWIDPDDPAPSTRFFHDHSQSVLTRNNSPDIPFDFSLNPYRGCEHGCIYCYARPTHEYLGLSAGLDFETQIFVKEDAPVLLRQELMNPRWQPQTISISGVTDPYQPIERRKQVTRRCLEVLAEFRNPVGIVTKNALVARDADLLGQLAQVNAALVFLSITTLDEELARKMEPRAATPAARLRAIRTLRDAGVPVGVLVAPIIPGLTDHEAPSIMAAAFEAGATYASYVLLRLPLAVKDLFTTWLEQHYPARKEKVLGRVRDVRDGKLNETRFAVRMRGEGEWADVFSRFFKLQRKRVGMSDTSPSLSSIAFRRPKPIQQTLFDDVD